MALHANAVRALWAMVLPVGLLLLLTASARSVAPRRPLLAASAGTAAQPALPSTTGRVGGVRRAWNAGQGFEGRRRAGAARKISHAPTTSIKQRARACVHPASVSRLAVRVRHRGQGRGRAASRHHPDPQALGKCAAGSSPMACYAHSYGLWDVSGNDMMSVTRSKSWHACAGWRRTPGHNAAAISH